MSYFVEKEQAINKRLYRNSFTKPNAITKQLMVKNPMIANSPLNTIEYKSISSNHYTEGNPIGVGSMNESLERIGTSLQKLIQEAQASLVNPQHIEHSPQDDVAERNTIRITESPYRYIQRQYAQSQTKLTLALEQLEKTIQYIPTIMMAGESTNIDDHGSASSTTSVSSNPRKEPQRRYKVPWATWGLMITLLIYSFYRPKSMMKYRHIQVSLLLLSTSFFYRRLKLNQQCPVINRIDYCILRLSLSKGTPTVCGLIHSFNLVLCLNKIK